MPKTHTIFQHHNKIALQYNPFNVKLPSITKLKPTMENTNKITYVAFNKIILLQ